MKKRLLVLSSMAVVLALTACSSNETPTTEAAKPETTAAAPAAETVEAVSKGFGGDVKVVLTFEGDKIVAAEATGEKETPEIGGKALTEIADKIVEAGGVDGVDTVAGATVTSDAVLSAAKKAIDEKNGVAAAEISYKPGTYEGTAAGYHGDIKVSVTVDEKSIKEVMILEQNETYGIGQGMDTSPINSLPGKIVELQGLGVDAVTGATVSSNGVVNAVLNALEQTCEDPAPLKDIVEKSEPKDETYEVDVVVVGAGSTGMSAAIEAAENGASVLLVEKQGIVGGAAARSGGKLMAAGTEYQKEQNIEDNPQKMFDYLKSVGGEYIDDEKLMAFCENSLDVFDWMVDMGVQVQDIEPIHSSLKDWRVHNTMGGGGMTDGHGGQITVPMYERYKSLDQGMLYNTTIDTILMNDQNEAVGVSGVKKDGSKVTVNAKAVILATGGYANNKDMVKTYGEEFPFYATGVPSGNVGDGITMAEKVGAQIFENPAVQVVFLDYNSGVGINEEAGLILNQEGKRVANEYSYQFHVSDQVAKTGSTGAWYIATANDPTPTVQYAMTLDKTLQASSLEELAGLMEVDPQVLTDTVARYNELCTKGSDDDFGKPAEYLYPIEGDTYYALKMMPSVTVTYSGIVTDINARVLDADNQPIANLYAAGETAFPGLFGTEYPGCGMAISGGAYYGRVAGKLAAESK
ncbi:MAG: FAD-dependent oxidoreductase [Lachnospiraceae bacterium]